MPGERDDGATRPRVLILGGGFAGVGAAQKLEHADADVVLVDKHDYHTFQPLLYQLATGLLEQTAVGHSLRDLLHDQDNTTVHQDVVTAIDLKAREVQFGQLAPLTYDYLVLGIGAEVDGGDDVLMDRRVLLVVQEVAKRMAYGGLLEQTGRKLVQERLERVVVVLVDQHHFSVGILQVLRGADPGEASAEDQHARARSAVVALAGHRTGLSGEPGVHTSSRVDEVGSRIGCYPFRTWGQLTAEGVPYDYSSDSRGPAEAELEADR